METVFHNDKNTASLNLGQFSNIELLDKCVKEIEPELITRPEITIYGRVCTQQRYVNFYSNESIGYSYSKNIVRSKPLTPLLLELLNTINETVGSKFNGILVNKYENGNDYIGPHSDDESGLDSVGVVCISYGEARKFRIRDKSTKEIVYEINTTNGSILQMSGEFQKLYTHEIPVQKRIKSSRISFTFRKHII